MERELVGGECSYWACMPSKALLRPGELLAEVARVPGAAEAVAGRDVDAAATLRRRDEVIHDRSDASQMPWLEKRGIALLRGHARLDGERRVRVRGDGDEDVHEAREAVVLATGSAALIPPIPGLREAQPWTNREATTAEEVPGELVVLGGGVAGVELAQAWRSLGARVTIVEAAERLIAREEPFASEQVAEVLLARGVALALGARATAVARDAGTSRTTVTLEDGAEIAGDRLLVAIGRRPRTDDLGLETRRAGARRADRGRRRAARAGAPVAVRDRRRQRPRPADAHGQVPGARRGRRDLRRRHGARCRSTGRCRRARLHRAAVAAVGHTLAAAREAGLDARAVDVDTAGTAGASFHGRNAPGTTRFVVDDERGRARRRDVRRAGRRRAAARGDDRDRGEVPLTALAHASPSSRRAASSG